MVDPALVAVGGAVLAIGGAAVYAFTTGNEASADVDIDGDGESDASVTFNHDDPEESETEAQPEDPTPDYVTDDYDGLEDITGIGPTRADDIADAGLPDPVDVYYASDATLLDINGIGPRALEQIRGDIGGIDSEGNGQSDEVQEDSSSSDEPSE